MIYGIDYEKSGGGEEPARCASCHKTADKLYPTYWIEEPVCADCVLHSDEFPAYCWENRPTPPQVLAAVEQSPTIEAVRAAFRLIEPAQGELFERKPAAQVPGVYRSEVA